jgi:hypothetical protein
MSILRSIWNGPFFVGKLTQPVSVGDVLLKILEVIWRAIISTIGLGLSITGYVYYIHPGLFPPVKDSVSGSAIYAVDLPPVVKTVSLDGKPLEPSKEEIEKTPCSREFPLRVSFFNEGSKTISRIDFDVEGYAQGFSTNYVDGIGYAPSERIIRPGQGWSSCYGVSTKNGVNPGQLEYKVVIWSAAEAK